jgi:hypothetical protein
MRTLQAVPVVVGRLVLITAVVLGLGGCATQRIDWRARVGNYTLDQAIVDLGPPDKQAKLTDGTVVAEWLTRRGYRYSTYVGGFYGVCSPLYYGPPYPTYVDSYAPDYFLRLTFGPEGRLEAWKRFAK